VKLHDLKPAPGSRREKRRVGRGIAAGQGKTAGRGTKGQKARAGGKIPAWFEGGQTPLHQRIPKLRGFRNPFKVEYEVVNVGDIARLVELGALESGDMPGSKGSAKGTPAPITVNQEILRAAGLVRRLDRPMKVLGAGELGAALFVVADAFSASARTKIEAAGGSVSVLEVPDATHPALGVEEAEEAAPAQAARGKRAAAEAPVAEAAPTDAEAPTAVSEPVAAEPDAARAPAADEAPAEAPVVGTDEPRAPKPGKGKAVKGKAVKGKAGAAAAPTAGATDDVDSDAADAEPAAPKPRAARKPRAPKPDTDA
jgi:large subunit ribosomal protein L15